MVALTSLWAPILVAAVLVFVVSSIIHMVLPYHRTDFGRLPAEDDVMDALRRFKIPPGDYFIPCPGSPDIMRSTAFQEKMTRGPVAVMTMMESGPPKMGPSLAWWFVYSIVVGIFAGYVASRALPAGAEYLDVFRFAGTVAFVGYALALWQNTIWYKRSVSATLKSTLDGLIYALLTAGVFGWLWPR
ncbi:MAG: hypothetical protein ACRD26_00680 [Vicinamibacterales bacterium]